jgi:hypothetical protein
MNPPAPKRLGVGFTADLEKTKQRGRRRERGDSNGATADPLCL